MNLYRFMNKNINWGFILLLLIANLASCTKTEYITISPDKETPDTKTYTIMMYGCGGGNLDPAMVLNIQEALLAGATDRVNFTGQIKFSKRYHVHETFAGTQRFIVGEAGQTWYEPEDVLDTELKLYDPQNLTDFINWSKAQKPADEYILLLWNHGGAWLPRHESMENRAIIYDDVNNNIGLSLNGLTKGIKDSNTKFKMIYYDACLMGMIENLAGLVDCTEYTMCASHITPGMGGDYNSLIYHLNNSTNFEQAMKEYCNETVAHWDQQGVPLDLMLVNNSKMDLLLEEMSVLSGYLKEAAEIYANYNEETDANDNNKRALCEVYSMAVNSCYHYDFSFDENGVAHYPFYDIHSLVELLANGNFSTYSAKFVDISSRINRAFKNAVVCKKLTSPINSLDIAMGVTIVDQKTWNDYQYNTTYDQLLFHQKTGWGDWLKMNPIRPTGNPNPKSYVDFPDYEDTETNPSVEEEIAYLLQLIGKN